MPVKLHYENNIAVIQLHRPEARNALNAEMIENLQKIVSEISTLNLRAAIFVGEGKAFCAGADITELLNKSPAEHLHKIQIGQALFQQIHELKFPTLACIHGMALGGGLELALACTFRICSPDAGLGLPEIKLGLIPGYGGTQRLPRLIGVSKALEMVASGKIVSAEEAYNIGLVNQIIDMQDPIESGKAYLDSLSAQFPAAIQQIMQAVQSATDLNIYKGLELEAKLFVECSQSADAVEGIQAFLEKRKANFSQK